MCAHNASGHGIGCQAVRTPYIYIVTHIQAQGSSQKKIKRGGGFKIKGYLWF